MSGLMSTFQVKVNVILTSGGGFESEITAGAWGTGGGRGGGLKIKSVIRFADIGLYCTLVGRWPRRIFDF